MRTCSKCKEPKADTEFAVRDNSTGRLHAQCRKCQSDYRKKHYEDNLDKYKRKARSWSKSNPMNGAYTKVKKHYAGTYSEFVSEVKALRRDCGNKCCVCGDDESKLSRRLCIDHCHASGRLRGLLCDSCNLALGKLRENFSIVMRLADYVKNRCGVDISGHVPRQATATPNRSG